jgi:hypothetical protein
VLRRTWSNRVYQPPDVSGGRPAPPLLPPRGCPHPIPPVLAVGDASASQVLGAGRTEHLPRWTCYPIEQADALFVAKNARSSTAAAGSTASPRMLIVTARVLPSGLPLHPTH